MTVTVSTRTFILREYNLTDGVDVYATRLLSEPELAELNRKAKEASDGEVWWELKPKKESEATK